MDIEEVQICLCLCGCVYKLLVRDYYVISHVGVMNCFLYLLEICLNTLQSSNKQTGQLVASIPVTPKQVV